MQNSWGLTRQVGSECSWQPPQGGPSSAHSALPHEYSCTVLSQGYMSFLPILTLQMSLLYYSLRRNRKTVGSGAPVASTHVWPSVLCWSPDPQHHWKQLRSHWRRVGPNPTWLESLQIWTQKQAHRRMPHRVKTGCAATSQGTTRSWERSLQHILPWHLQREKCPACWDLGLGFPASRAVEP